MVISRRSSQTTAVTGHERMGRREKLTVVELAAWELHSAWGRRAGDRLDPCPKYLAVDHRAQHGVGRLELL
jgi:hypothetical protein